MGNYVEIEELGNYFPADRLLALVDAEAGETLDAPGAATEAVINAAIAAAETECDGYLRAQFAVPVSPVSDELKRTAAVITIFNLFRRKPEYKKAYRADYDEAVAWLEKIRDSENQVGGEITSAAADTVLSSDSAGIFMVGGSSDLTDF
jgi:phage gp36-like protein